jgi:hypothetical protein
MGEGSGVRGPRLSRRGRAILRQSAPERNRDHADFRIREADHAHAEAFENLSPPSVMAGKPFVLLAGLPGSQSGGPPRASRHGSKNRRRSDRREPAAETSRRKSATRVSDAKEYLPPVLVAGQAGGRPPDFDPGARRSDVNGLRPSAGSPHPRPLSRTGEGGARDRPGLNSSSPRPPARRPCAGLR